MAEAPRSSFIPKQASSAVPTSARRKKRFHVFSFLSTVLLLGSLALAAGAYFYRNYSERELETQKSLLATEGSRFSESDITAVQEFDRKLSAARLLLDNHMQPSKIFDALERSAMERIQYTGFSYSQARQHVSVTLAGATQEFSTVALQELEFGANSVLDEVVFTTLTTSQEISDRSETGSAPAVAGPRIGLEVTGSIEKSKVAFDGTDIEPREASSQEQTEEVEASAPDSSSEPEGARENEDLINNGT